MSLFIKHSCDHAPRTKTSCSLAAPQAGPGSSSRRSSPASSSFGAHTPQPPPAESTTTTLASTSGRSDAERGVFHSEITTRGGGKLRFQASNQPTIFSVKIAQSISTSLKLFGKFVQNTLTSGNHLGFPAILARYTQFSTNNNRFY